MLKYGTFKVGSVVLSFCDRSCDTRGVGSKYLKAVEDPFRSHRRIDESAAIALVPLFIRRKVFENIFKPFGHRNTYSVYFTKQILRYLLWYLPTPWRFKSSNKKEVLFKVAQKIFALRESRAVFPFCS